MGEAQRSLFFGDMGVWTAGGVRRTTLGDSFRSRPLKPIREMGRLAPAKRNIKRHVVRRIRSPVQPRSRQPLSPTFARPNRVVPPTPRSIS